MQMITVAIFAIMKGILYKKMNFLLATNTFFSYQKTHIILSEDLQTISVHPGGELKNAGHHHETIIQNCYVCRYADHPFPASHHCRLC